MWKIHRSIVPTQPERQVQAKRKIRQTACFQGNEMKWCEVWHCLSLGMLYGLVTDSDVAYDPGRVKRRWANMTPANSTVYTEIVEFLGRLTVSWWQVQQRKTSTDKRANWKLTLQIVRTNRVNKVNRAQTWASKETIRRDVDNCISFTCISAYI